MEIVSIFVFICLVLFLRFMFVEDMKGMTYVTSSVDGKEYLVRDLPDKQTAADMLARVREKLTTLTEHMKKTYPDDKRVQFLNDHYHNDNTELSESTPSVKYTSYNVNKGDAVKLCVRQRNDAQEIIEENTITFVAIHELAHSMTKEHGHTQTFWANFKLLLQEAVKIKLYRPQDFEQNHAPYCGIKITDSPLF